MPHLQSVAVVVAVLTLLLAATTWMGSGQHRVPARLWLAGFGAFTASMALTLAAPLLGHSPLAGAVASFLVTLGSWFHYAGVSSLLQKKRRTSHLVLLALIAVVHGVSGSVLVIDQTWTLSRLVESLFNLLFLVLMVSTLCQTRETLSTDQKRFIVWAFSGFGLVYLLSSIGVVAGWVGYQGWEVLANPLMILGPLEWVLALVLLALGENGLLLAVTSAEREKALQVSEDRRVQLQRLNRELHQFQSQILLTLAQLLESRTEETSLHVGRVSELTRQILLQLGLGSEYANFVAEASTLHDIGKVGIPDEILKKRGVLDDQERRIMHDHTLLGFELLRKSDVPFFQLAARIAGEHHEHWDGTGYPLGRQGEEICLEARVVAVADAYDALTSQRSYKPAWPIEQAREYLREHAGTRFDPQVIDAFLVVHEEL